jgi:hypothetical protein
MSQQPPNASPDTYPSSSNTPWSHTESSTGTLMVSLEASLPLPSPLPLPSSLPPSLPLEECHDITSPSQVTGKADTTDTTVQVVPLQTTRMSLEPLSINSGGVIGSSPIPVLYNNRPNYHSLSCFVLWLTHLVEAGNIYLEVWLNYGGRHTRSLLNWIFAFHPLLYRVYVIMESALLPLHPVTLLLTCMLYIQEAILLASQMEPAIVA